MRGPDCRFRRIGNTECAAALGLRVTSQIGLRSERGPVLLALMVATGVVAVEATILSTAIPAIVGEIGGFSQFPWLFSIFLLAQAVTVPLYAKRADMIGRRPIILIGLAVFLVGSVLCGVAWDMPSLIAFRAIQGIGAGAILPITITIVGDIYTVAERARVQGYIASVWAVASIAGPTLGGLFAAWGAWRWIFFVNIPLCLLAGWLVIRSYHENVERHRHRIDYLGAALLTVSLVLLLLATLEGGNAWAWNSPPSIALFAVGGALLVAFFIVEKYAAEPVFPLWLFGRRLLASTNLVGVAIGMTLIGLTAFIPTYLVTSIGVGELAAGLALAPLILGWPLAASISGRIYLRFGFRFTVLLGGVLVVFGTATLALIGPYPSLIGVGVVCFVIGLGLGFAAVPSLVAAQASVEWAERGVVTGASVFSRSIGQAVGAAVLGAVANGVISARGGDETDPATMTAAGTAVFIGAAIVGVLLLVGAFLMPRERGAHASMSEPVR